MFNRGVLDKITDSTKGFSLIEALLGAAILALLATMLVPVFIYGQETTLLSGQTSRAIFLAQEGLEGARSIRDKSFNNLADGDYGLEILNNAWAFLGSSDAIGIFTREISVSTVSSSTKEVISRVSWRQNGQRDGEIALTTRLGNWSGQ